MKKLFCEILNKSVHFKIFGLKVVFGRGKFLNTDHLRTTGQFVWDSMPWYRICVMNRECSPSGFDFEITIGKITKIEYIRWQSGRGFGLYSNSKPFINLKNKRKELS